MDPAAVLQASRIARLRETALFGGLRDDALAYVIERAQEVDVTAQAYFFHEGDPGDIVYLLEAGSAAIVKHCDGGERVLRVLGPGECFGEMSLMDFSPRSASARATSPCHALAVSGACLHALYERDVEQFALIEMNMGREVSRRLREADAAWFAQGARR